MEKNVFCYPSYTKKAITFSMDDGNMTYDKKFIEIVKKGGITGTFNLSGARAKGNLSNAEYVEFYKGFGIANHCSLHPKVILPTDTYVLSDKPFDMETSDYEYIYETGREGIYYKRYTTWWGYVATTDAYITLIDEGKSELDSIFGKENITGFVWPYHEQDDDALKAYLKSAGYKSVRKTGESSFDIPEDKMRWSYNAIHTNLLQRAENFAALADDGKLKFLCIGVHPIDFERAGTWGDLEKFVEIYGNRKEEFWYATPEQILEYDDAVNAAQISESAVVNNSDITLYAIVDGAKLTIPPLSRVEI